MPQYPPSTQSGISIHSLRMEGDDTRLAHNLLRLHFNPLPPHGGRPESISTRLDAGIHFNPLPPHGGRQKEKALRTLRHISIHSLRMEGDLGRKGQAAQERDFNPLPPHGGRRPACDDLYNIFIFQSTPSAWRETCSVSSCTPPFSDFNPLPPHGGRHVLYLLSAIIR